MGSHTVSKFAKVLRDVRLSQETFLSQSKLAEKLGCDHSYISRLEDGSRLPSREFLVRMTMNLEMSTVVQNQLFTSAGFSPPVSIGDLHFEILYRLDKALQSANLVVMKSSITFLELIAVTLEASAEEH